MKLSRNRSLFLITLGVVAPILTAKAARVAAGKGFEAVTDKKAPRNPASPEVEWGEAVAWTVFTGVVGGLASLTVRRYLAESDAISLEHEDDGLLD